MMRVIVIFSAVLSMVFTLPPRPMFPVAELCDLYKEKCEFKLKNINCKERSEECLKYADGGLNITWQFCMFHNEDDETICRSRSLIDYEIIKTAVMNDSFKCDFAECQ